MKQNKIKNIIFLMLLGAILLVVGIFVIGDTSKTVSGLCLGIGAGLISMNAANLLISLYYNKRPDIKKQSDIDSKDERNISINMKAKAKAFDITIRSLIIIPFLLILTDSPLWMTLAAICIYLFGFSMQIYYTIRYNKEM
ncbi:hypothetical protein [Lachnoclostridium sp.]|uniref:hypothetical protein n=1 Tax=Lachnoclostridium sp. TaxID=2028282 RepID=UPI0028A09B21|nr:hypothetical protein [Lachnoclostridium sp.]